MQFGVVHILVACHGIFPSEEVPLWEMSLKQWKETIDVNLTGVFLCVREYLKQLKAFTGKLNDEEKNAFNACVILIGSTAGKFGEVSLER